MKIPQLCLVLCMLACHTAPTAVPAAASREILSTGKKLYSQNDEELIIRDFFEDRRGGFFLDVGAAHYKQFSTTFYLEQHLGWSGIAIDALSRYAPGYADHRPSTRFLSFIVTDHSGTEESLYVVAGAEGVSSTMKGWTESFARRFGPGEPEVTPIQVPTITLTEVLDRYAVERVDFVSIDIEGGEFQALDGFDLDRFKPELLCIESGTPVRARLVAALAERGYRPIEKYAAYDPVNVYFTRAETGVD